jgi:ankyrin repeat protein
VRGESSVETSKSSSKKDETSASYSAATTWSRLMSMIDWDMVNDADCAGQSMVPMEVRGSSGARESPGGNSGCGRRAFSKFASKTRQNMDDVHALVRAIQAPAPPLASSSNDCARDDRVDCAQSDFSRALAAAGRAGVIAPVGADAYTSLHWAAHCDEPALLRALLQAPIGSGNHNGNGADHSSSSTTLPSSPRAGHSASALHPDCVRSASGATPLHTACARGCVRAARVLLTLHADPCAANRWGENALHAAAGNGHADVVALLLQSKRSKPALESDDGSSELAMPSSDSPLAAAVLPPPCAIAVDQWARTPLRIARENAGAERVTPTIALLIAAGAPDSGAAADSHGLNTSDGTVEVVVGQSESAAVVSAPPPIAHQSVIAEFLAAVAKRSASAEPHSPPTLAVASCPLQAAASAVTTTSNTLNSTSSALGASAITVASPAAAAATQRPLPSTSLSKQIEYGISIAAVTALLAASASRAYVCGRDSFGMSALLKFAAWDLPEHVTLLIRHARASDAAAADSSSSVSAQASEASSSISVFAPAAASSPDRDSFEFALLTSVDPAGRTALHVAVEEGAWRALKCLLLFANPADSDSVETNNDSLAVKTATATAVSAFFRDARDKKGRSPWQVAVAAWGEQHVPSEVAAMLQTL